MSTSTPTATPATSPAHTPVTYGYARVSTTKQRRDGNSLEEQTALLKAQGCSIIFADACTGTKMDRPEFTRLLSALQPGDTLVVTKLDRFARSAHDGAKQLQDLIARGITVNILNMGRADSTPMGKLMLNILFAFAEFERDMIYERTQNGREWKRENDPTYIEGRKPVDLPLQSPEFLAFKAGEITAKECYTALGMKKATFYRKIREEAS